jgi:hypothetical protein
VTNVQIRQGKRDFHERIQNSEALAKPGLDDAGYHFPADEKILDNNAIL